MNRLNRRRFLALSSAGAASAVLVACGNPKPSAEVVNPTQIPDVAGAPPTLAPITSTPESGAAQEQPAGGGEQAAGGGGGAMEVDVKAIDIDFDPKEFTIAPGGTINLVNEGQLEHDIAVDEWGGVLIGPFGNGGSGSFTVPEDANPGDTFEYYCTIPGHKEAGMVGTLTIAEPGAGGGEEEATPEEAAAGGEGGATEFTLKAIDIDYDPKEFTIAPGGTLTLVNDGVLEHDIAIDDWGGILIGPLKAGESGDYTVPEDTEPGEYDFYCTIPGHKEAGMVGTLTVAAAGGGEAEATAEEEGTAETEATAEEGGEQAAAGGEAGATEFTLKAIDIDFDPKEFTIAPGGKLTMDNDGVLEHDIAVDAWGGILIGPLKGGESGDYTIPDDAKPGETFDFYCTIPGHKEAGMVGKLTIGEAGGGGEAAAGGEEAGEATEEASPEASPAASPAAEQGGGEGATEFTVKAIDIDFDPKEFTIARGGTITLENAGVLEHDFAVDAWDKFVIGPLKAGDSDSGTVPEDIEPGEYDYYCTIPGHKEAGMVGKVTVV